MIEIKKFGSCELGDVDAITIQNETIAFTVLSYGATVQKILVKDRQGVFRDVCLGYDTVEGYRNGREFIGAAIGRNGNRIKNAQFTLNGKTYQLTANEGTNQLHGGIKGFDKKLWQYETGDECVTFKTHLVDGEEGFPGNMDVEITYSIDGGNGLRIDYRAVCDADTVANFTNHSYFNLNGAGSGTIFDHVLWLDADRFTLTDDEQNPTGETAPVAGTCMDFTKPCTLGKRMDDALLAATRGYDHNFCLNGSGLRKVAEVNAPESGIRMDVETTLEGVQLYVSTGLTPQTGKDGKRYGYHSAFCLETQHYPNAINCPTFPSPVLKKGEQLSETTIYRFF